MRRGYNLSIHMHVMPFTNGQPRAPMAKKPKRRRRRGEPDSISAAVTREDSCHVAVTWNRKLKLHWAGRRRRK